ncbi:hypothetical protein I4U23_007730 [Adineta vaga]|nr:hypothetical protein I4U23_007730 [Adineta vaga]
MSILLLLLLLFLLIISSIVCIRLDCYNNASLIFLPTAMLYNNLTLLSCQCLLIQQQKSTFQYNSIEQTCYLFDYSLSVTNLQITRNSRVCYYNQTTTTSVYSETTTSLTILPYPPITVSTSVTGNNYYTVEKILLKNTVVLTSLIITISVPKNLGLSSPQFYGNYWPENMNSTLTSTNDYIIAIFYLMNGRTMQSQTWDFNVQFSLSGLSRSTSNDTYFIQIESFQSINGHF